MSQEKSISDKYLIADIARILDKKSKYTDSVVIKDEDIRINGKPLVEYIATGMFGTETDLANPDQRDTNGLIKDYNPIITNRLQWEQDTVEMYGILEFADTLFNRERLQFTRGYTISLDDPNQLLQERYPEILSAKLRNVTYPTELDLQYDIYRAAETLKVLFIQLPVSLVNQIPLMCHSYVDMITLPFISPFKEFCDANIPVCSVVLIDKEPFEKVVNTPEFAWIKEEIANPDIFNRVFQTNLDARRIEQEKNRKVLTLIRYMITIAKQDPTNYDLYVNQIKDGLRRPYTDEDLALADEVVRFVKLGLITSVTLPEEETVTSIDTILDPSIIGGRKITIFRLQEKITEPAFKVLAFDYPLVDSPWRDMGTYAVFRMIVEFLNLSTDDANQIVHESKSYSDLFATYLMVRKVAYRNKLAKNAMAAIQTWINTNPDMVKRYANKRITFQAGMNFLSGEPNFVGKCMEDMIENYEDIHQPVYQPMSPVFEQSAPIVVSDVPTSVPVTEGTPIPTSVPGAEGVPGVSKSVPGAEGVPMSSPPVVPLDPEDQFGLALVNPAAIPAPFSGWVNAQYQSVVKLSNFIYSDIRIPNLPQFLDFFRLFYTRFIDYNASPKAREQIDAYTSQYKFNTYMATFITKAFYSVIVDTMLLFNKKDDIFIFNKMIQEGNIMLSNSQGLDKQEIIRINLELLQYVCSALFIDMTSGQLVVNKMINDNSGQLSINRLNFWKYTMEAFKNPTNPYTLRLAVRKTIIFVNYQHPLPVVAQVQMLLRNYKGNKKVDFAYLLSGPTDITFSFVADYILQDPSLASLHSEAKKYVSKDLLEDTLNKLSSASGKLAVIGVFRRFFRNSFEQQMKVYNDILKNRIGQKGIDEANNYIKQGIY